jgi:hypothetical protein
MPYFALIALIAWIPFGAYLFRHYPVRIAILVNFLGGWALLPGADYVPTTADFPYWILGVCLPSSYFLTKATVTALAAAAGVLLFHSSDWKSFRPTLSDLPIALWCCVPLLSAAMHWHTVGEGLLGAVYQTIAWGVPWLLGRRYFSDDGSLLLAAKACVIAGICYIPICLIEFVTGPQFYAFFYGYQPYRWTGAGRYVGFRPIGFLEDGNQLGIWIAAATLLAISLALQRFPPRILNLPAWSTATALAATTLLCQSVGSIVLLLLLLPLILLKRRSALRGLIAAGVVAVVFLVLFRVANPVSLHALAQGNRFVHLLAAGLDRIGRHSLAWRLARNENHMRLALRHPLLGWGQWDWWRSADERPWGLWMLVFGMYGIVGLSAFGAILFLPVLRTAWPSPHSNNARETGLHLALAGLILMVACDSLLNGALILPYLLLASGLVSPRDRAGSTTDTFPPFPRITQPPPRRPASSAPASASGSSPARPRRLSSMAHR